VANHMFDRIRAGIAAADKTFLFSAERQLSYGEMFARSARYAGALQALGVVPGERVAVQIEKCVDAIALYLACLRTGAVLLPLNPAYTLAEMRYFCGDAEPRLIVCAPGREEEIRSIAGDAKVETLGPEGGSLARRASESDHGTDIGRGPDDLAAILYTSGTTGRPKGAMISHANLASNAAALVDLWQFTADDVLIHALPIFHTHGLFVAINVTLFAGSSLIFMPKFDPAEIASALPRATTLMGVPTFYVRLLNERGVTAETTRHMRLFVSGSAPLLSETFNAWREKTGHTILERYGMTETNMNTSNPYSGERIAGTVGKPLKDITIRIVNPETGAVLPDGEIGMVEVRGPNVFGGYWRMPEKTASEFRPDGFFITGDLGIIDSHGYLQIVGRGKDLIISGGFNVYPKEVETELDGLPGVVESAVIGLPHPDLGEAVAAVIVRKPGSNIDEAAVSKALSTRLARYKQPRLTIFVDDLPRNTMGKVQKSLLRDIYKGMFENVSG
jgi:malonyl-CoA/methylmalonyl-CoA synthetase